MHFPSVGDELELEFDDGCKLDVEISELRGEGMLTLVTIKETGEKGWAVFRKDGSYTWIAMIEEKEPWEK